MNVQLLSEPTHQFDAPRAAVVTTRLAELMGLYTRPAGKRIDGAVLGSVLAAAATAGLAEYVAAGDDAAAPSERTVRALLDTLLASPRPAHEIVNLVAIFGYSGLERLSGTSEPSLRRYAAEDRQTPDPVARRLHFLATIVAILRGSFNAFGIRRWFERAHPALDGRAPAQLLGPGIEPEDDQSRAVMSAALGLLA